MTSLILKFLHEDFISIPFYNISVMTNLNRIENLKLKEKRNMHFGFSNLNKFNYPRK